MNNYPTCRACLLTINNANSFVNLSDPLQGIKSDGCNVTYLDAFISCSGLLVMGAPRELCDECASELLVSYKFKEKCQRSQKELEKWFENEDKTIDMLEFQEVEIKMEVSEEGELGNIEETQIEMRQSCHLCDEKYKLKGHLRDHYKLKHPNDEKKCAYCNKKFFPSFLQEHIEKLHKTDMIQEENTSEKKQYPCELCVKSYRRKKNLKFHMNLKHPEALTAVCPHCEGKYLTQFLDGHVKRCKKRPPKTLTSAPYHVCPICGEVKSETHIRNHIERDSKKSNPYICDLCGSNHYNKYGLVKHFKRHHLRLPFICKICGDYFNTDHSLYLHIRRIHPNVMPDLKCSECDFTADNSGILQYHKRKNHRPPVFYKCSVCPKQYPSNTKRREHEKCHSDDRPFQCPICAATFKTARYLGVHKKSHREKDYECPVCLNTFISNKLLSQHAKNKHPEYQMPPPGTIMSKSFRKRMAEKQLKLEALRKGLDKRLVEAIKVNEPPSLEEMHLIHPFKGKFEDVE